MQRTHTRKMRWALGLLAAILAFAGCTTSTVAERPLSTADLENWSVHVLTWDADGDRRKTRVWIAAVDGIPYIRTTQSRWWHNIERGSPTEILSAGRSYPVAPESVDAAGLRARIDEAFAAKYGWLGRLVIEDERATSNDPYLRLKPAVTGG